MKNRYMTLLVLLAVVAATGVERCKAAEPADTVDEAAVKAAAEKAEREKVAFAPIILEEIIPGFAAEEANRKGLAAVAKAQKPSRGNQFLRDIVYTLTTYYRQAGVQDYDWHDFGPQMKDAEWWYFSFDPKETRDKSSGGRYRKTTYPEGMENWFAKDFDAKAAGWTTGKAPFGQKDGEKVAIGSCPSDSSTGCRCGVAPGTLWEKEVILIRQTFKVPPLKKGCRYRLVVGGSNHVNGGDGFDLYVDGKLLNSSSSGVGKRQGGQPRGGHFYSDFLPELKDGELTVAVRSFLRYNHPRIKPFPPSGHLSVWLEEQQLPPEVLAVAEASK